MKNLDKIFSLSNTFISDVKDRIEEISDSESEVSLFQDRATDYMESLVDLLDSAVAKVKKKSAKKVKKVKSSPKVKVKAKSAKAPSKPKAKAAVVKKKAAKTEKKAVKKPSALNSSHILAKAAKHFGGVKEMSKALGTSESNIFGILRKNGNVSNALALKIEEATDGKFSYKKLTGKKKAA